MAMAAISGQYADALGPLMEALSPDTAMADLVVTGRPDRDLVRLAEEAASHELLRSSPELLAGVWLYIDDLDRSHAISQGIDDATGSFWHGIMHRREGDFSNSHYWFRKVGNHPVVQAYSAQYDPHQFIDDVEAAHRQGGEIEGLVDLQRLEWFALFGWCTENCA